MQTGERRFAPRFPYAISVDIEWGSKNLRASATDLSLTGMRVQLPDPLWVGAEFSAVLLLDKPIRVDVVVRRVEPGNGMGLQFKNLTKEALNSLQELVASLPRE